MNINETALLQDKCLTPEQLDEKYNFEGDGEHPAFTRLMWGDEAFLGHTLRGYWDWVASQIEQACDELPEPLYPPTCRSPHCECEGGCAYGKRAPV